MNIPSVYRIANIDQNDAMILPHDANLRRMTFSEATGNERALEKVINDALERIGLLLPCRKAGKPRVFTAVRESSGESRLK